jgi:hypothetical protein
MTARRSNRYMVAVYHIFPDKSKGQDMINLTRYQVGFPVGELPGTVNMLRENIEKEFGPPPKTEMPKAEGVRRISDLMGTRNPFQPPKPEAE